MLFFPKIKSHIRCHNGIQEILSLVDGLSVREVDLDRKKLRGRQVNSRPTILLTKKINFYKYSSALIVLPHLR